MVIFHSYVSLPEVSELVKYPAPEKNIMVTKKPAEMSDSLQIQSHSNGELSVSLGGLLRRLMGGFSRRTNIMLEDVS